MGNNMVPLIGFGIMILLGGIVFLVMKFRGNKEPKTKQYEDSKELSGYKKNPSANVNKEDIFNFLDFDRIQDNMIVSQNGEKYTAVLKCKGINYNLMSEMEQLAVEEGFINFLNTLKFPIQLYVQVQNINLKDNIKKYRENMSGLNQEMDDLSNDYNIAVNSLDATDEEVEEAEDRKNSVQNVIEYGQDIVRYVEKLSLNKSMLQRNFYVLCSYYKSEISASSTFKPGEILDICYSELFTRVQNVISGLSMSSVSAEPMDSNELAELLYSAYNRDDYNFMSVKDALASGFHRLYSTSEDAITKKNEMLLENIRKEAEYKAVQALAEAIDSGEVATVEDAVEEFDEETSKQALEIIKHERVDDKIKEKAKKIVVNDYKEAKKKRMESKRKTLEKFVGANPIESKDVDLQEQGISNSSTDIVARDVLEDGKKDEVIGVTDSNNIKNNNSQTEDDDLI